MTERRKKILTSDLFFINEKGEVVVKDRALADRIRAALQSPTPERPAIAMVDPLGEEVVTDDEEDNGK